MGKKGHGQFCMCGCRDAERLARASRRDSSGGRSSRDNNASMMYGRRYRSSQEPVGASGSINPRTGEGHMSQYYADNTRVSWDTDGQGGESRAHWTNQNVGKKNQNRHTPPPHAD